MKLIFLFVALVIGIAFNAVPSGIETIQMFPFADTAITFKTWLYFLCEHIVLIMLSYVIAYEAKEYKLQCKVFFWIQVADLADYLLTYNTNWIGPLNFNIIAVLIFATSIFYEYGRDRD